jgi:dTDP-4-amino-4,6-dideoxygalactose transaminase
VCVSTGTAALQLALEAIGVGPGDEVLVPSLAYLAAFQAVSATGAGPVPVDVELSSLSMSPSDASSAISPRTRAIMPIDYAGGAPNIVELLELAGHKGLRLIEDAAHAFGTTVKGRRIGSFGDIVCFSFDPIKNITSIEGGAVVSDDIAVIDRVKTKRLLGVIGDSEARNQQRRLYEFDVQDQGWRYHMSNVNAAVGRVQLGAFLSKATKRRELACIYEAYFLGSSWITTLDLNYEDVVPHIYVVRFPSKGMRDLVRATLGEELGVETGLHWYPNHLLTKFRSRARSLPNTLEAFSTMLTLPLHTRLKPDDVRRVAEKVVEVCTNANR